MSLADRQASFRKKVSEGETYFKDFLDPHTDIPSQEQACIMLYPMMCFFTVLIADQAVFKILDADDFKNSGEYLQCADKAMKGYKYENPVGRTITMLAHLVHGESRDNVFEELQDKARNELKNCLHSDCNTA